MLKFSFLELHYYASNFNMCFIKFWMKLDEFIMVKVGNALVNKDHLLWISEFTNRLLNSLIIKPSIMNLLIVNHEPKLNT
jgi:hypothetical protein